MEFIRFTTGQVYYIFHKFCVYEKKYGNEWMSPLVDLSVLELVHVIFCASFTQNEGFIE